MWKELTCFHYLYKTKLSIGHIWRTNFLIRRSSRIRKRHYYCQNWADWHRISQIKFLKIHHKTLIRFEFTSYQGPWCVPVESLHRISSVIICVSTFSGSHSWCCSTLMTTFERTYPSWDRWCYSVRWVIEENLCCDWTRVSCSQTNRIDFT